jgi:hypothetical protein
MVAETIIVVGVALVLMAVAVVMVAAVTMKHLGKLGAPRIVVVSTLARN